MSQLSDGRRADMARAANDAFPMFSDAEMARRLTRVQEAMAVQGTDALVVYGHTGMGTSVGQVNLQYLARYAAVVETYLVVPQDGEPTLLLAIPFHVDNARAISSVDDIRWGDALGNAVVRLEELGLARGRIGVVGPGAMSHAGLTMFHEQWLRLEAALPDATLDNVTAWFDDLRLVKSDEELAVLRRAGAWTDIAHEEVFQLTESGASPRELRRAMDVVAARAGATFPFGHIGAISMSEPHGYYPDFYPVDAPIDPGSLVMTEFALGFGNYFAKLWGSYFVGEPTDDYRRLFEVAAAVHEHLERDLRAGLTGRDVEAFLAPITEAGFEQPANVLVGGWSAMNHPPQMGALPSSLSAPFAKPFLDVELQARQAVTIQAWVSIPGTNKGLWVGSSGVVTESGYESFNRYPIGDVRIAGAGARPDPAPQTMRYFPVRGRVITLTDQRLSVQDAGGTVTHMHLQPDWSVQVMRSITFEDLELGRFVGAIEVPDRDAPDTNGDTAGRAVELHMFLPGVRMGEGQQPWDRPFGSRMTQGELTSATTTEDRVLIELAHHGQRRRLWAPRDVPVVLVNNEGRENIEVGVEVLVLAWPEPDGRLRVDAVATADAGALPPL